MPGNELISHQQNKKHIATRLASNDIVPWALLNIEVCHWSFADQKLLMAELGSCTPAEKKRLHNYMESFFPCGVQREAFFFPAGVQPDLMTSLPSRKLGK